MHRQLLEALGTLPPEQRAALVLVDMQGYPVAEAARILDVPTGTVKSRCARGRARLLPLLTHLRPEGTGAPERAVPDPGKKPAEDGTAGRGHPSHRRRGPPERAPQGSGTELIQP